MKTLRELAEAAGEPLALIQALRKLEAGYVGDLNEYDCVETLMAQPDGVWRDRLLAIAQTEEGWWSCRLEDLAYFEVTATDETTGEWSEELEVYFLGNLECPGKYPAALERDGDLYRRRPPTTWMQVLIEAVDLPMWREAVARHRCQMEMLELGEELILNNEVRRRVLQPSAATGTLHRAGDMAPVGLEQLSEHRRGGSPASEQLGLRRSCRG